MKKEILNKKIELFKEKFPEWTLSKNDNFVWSDESRNLEKHSINPFSVTKNSLANFGKRRIYTRNDGTVFLLKKTGALYLIDGNSKNRRYKKITSSTLRKIKEEPRCKIAPVFFLGKKYEWMLDYPNFWSVRFFQSFSSLEEAKTFLGWEAISDKSLHELFKDFEIANLMFRLHKEIDKFIALYLLNENKKKIVQELTEYLDLCKTMGIEPEIPIDEKTLVKLCAEKRTESKIANNFSKERIYYSSKMFDFWNEQGLDYVVADSPFSMVSIHTTSWFARRYEISDCESLLHVGIKTKRGFDVCAFSLKGELVEGRLDEKFLKKEPITVSLVPIETNYKRLD